MTDKGTFANVGQNDSLIYEVSAECLENTYLLLSKKSKQYWVDYDVRVELRPHFTVEYSLNIFTHLHVLVL